MTLASMRTQLRTRKYVPFLNRLAVSACLCLAGCSSLLPSSDAVLEGQWNSFEDAQRTFDKIIPYQTTVEDLKTLGLDARTTPNITLLNYSDVLQRFIPSPSINSEELDSGVSDCLKAKMACRGYEIDQRSIKRNRYGNFWVDWLNFKRKVDVTGWHFRGMVLIKDELVVYKLVGGQPMIHELEKSDNPLGPFQGVGESTLRSQF
ncbi:MAG: hypothetical protein H6R08_1515 [Proteobacteria bacterium]|nr:hypothetical protein [Pseudomonadota bacterium]